MVRQSVIDPVAIIIQFIVLNESSNLCTILWLYAGAQKRKQQFGVKIKNKGTKKNGCQC